MSNKKTVFISGNFNVLHPGHLRLLRFAKECGNYVIVAVTSDLLAKQNAHVPENLRLECVSSNSWVDEAFLIHEPVCQIIEKRKPDIVVKGKEHELLFNPEKELVESYGGQLVFSSGESIFSSLDLLQKEFKEINTNNISLPYDYLARHQIKVDDLKNILNQFKYLNVCVIGDLIIDEYITCEPLGMSQEDPTIVVTPIDSTKFVGGAGIVAAHAAGLGANVNLISIVGNDENKKFALNSLIEYGVKADLLEDTSRPTTLKQRFRSKGKSLLRVSHLHQTAINPILQKKLLNILKEIINKIDILVFSDFNYGCLPQKIVDQIINLANKHDVKLAADSQSSSQVGDISRFKYMDLITPTEREARISMRNHEDGLVVLAESLRKQSNSKNILLKLGSEGILIHALDNNDKDCLTDRVRAMNVSPKDVAGAGDSLLITSALTLASGHSIWEATYLGSLAAAVQVGRVGNTPIQLQELITEFR